MAGRKSKHKKHLSTFSEKEPLCVGQLQLYVGAKIEALDSNKWYQAKVVKINEKCHKVLVHFDGWNSRHDTWFHFKTESLRPLKTSEDCSPESNNAKELFPGDRVLARWSDSKFYPAKVCSAVKDGSYEVVFYDGFKKSLSKSNIRPDRKRTFETYEEKFKDVAPPSSPSPLDPLSPGTDESATPLTSRVKRRHAEPSTMVDFITTIPGKKYKKSFVGDSMESWEKMAMHEADDNVHKDSDTESQTSLTKSDRRKRHSSPCGSMSSISSRASSKISPPDRQPSKSTPRDGNREGHSRLSPERYIGDTSGRDKEGKTGRKRKPPSSLLKVKLPIRSPGSRMRAKKKDFAAVEAPAEPDLSHDNKDIKAGDRMEEDFGHISDKTQKAYGYPVTERELVDLAIDVEDQGKTGSNSASAAKEQKRKLTPTKSSGAHSPDKRSTSFSEETKRLPRRERKLTEKGLELQQSIVFKKRIECWYDDRYDSEAQGSSLKKSEDIQRYDGPSQKPYSGRIDSCGSAKVSDSEEMMSDRKNIKFLSESKLEWESDKLDSKLVYDSVLKSATSFERKDTSRSDEIETSIDRSSTPIIDKDDELVVVETPDGNMLTKPVAESFEDDAKADFDEDQYSEADSEGSLIIDIDDVEDNEDSKDNSNNSSLRTETSVKDADSSPEDKTKVIQRHYPRIKYTLSHEERSRNRTYKNVKPKKQLIKRETNEVFVETAHKEEANREPIVDSGSNPLMSLTKLVADKGREDKEYSMPVQTPADDVKIGESISPASISPVDSKTELKQQKQKSRGPSRPRIRTKDQFLSMVAQDRPSQIERPISKDLVYEKSVTRRPRNRSSYWARINENLKQETAMNSHHDGLASGELNKPLEFPPYQDEIHNQATNRINEASRISPIDRQRLSEETHMKMKSKSPVFQERRTPEFPEGFGGACYYPYKDPHFVAGVERRTSPITIDRYTGVEPRFGGSPYHMMDSPSAAAVRPGSPQVEVNYLSCPSSWVSKDGVVEGPYPYHVRGAPPPYPISSGNMARVGSNHPLHQAGSVMRQLAPGVPNYYRPPATMHHNMPFSAKASNCEEYWQENRPVHRDHGKLPHKPEQSMAIQHLAKDSPEQSRESKCVSPLFDKKPDNDKTLPAHGKTGAVEEPSFLITDVVSLRGSVGDSKVEKPAVIGELALYNEQNFSKNSKPGEPSGEFKETHSDSQTGNNAVMEDIPVKPSTSSEMESIENNPRFLDRKSGDESKPAAKNAPQNPDEPFESQAEGNPVSEDNPVKPCESHAKSNLNVTPKDTSSNLLKSSDSQAEKKRAGSKDELANLLKFCELYTEQNPAVSKHNPSESHTESKAVVSTDKVENPAKSGESLSEELPIQDHSGQSDKSLSKSNLDISNDQDVSDKPSQILENVSKTSMRGDSSSPPVQKLTKFESKKKRLDFITGKLSAQKQNESTDVTQKDQTDILLDADHEQPKTDPHNEGASPVAQNPLVKPNSIPPMSSGVNIDLSTSFTPDMIQLHRQGLHPDGSINVAHPRLMDHPSQIYRAPGPHLIPVSSFHQGNAPVEDHLMLTYPPTSALVAHHATSIGPIRPMMDPDGVVVSGYHSPMPPRMVYPPLDIQGQPQFIQTVDGKGMMHQFAYGQPRYAVPQPGYFHPMEAGGVHFQAMQQRDPRMMMDARFFPISSSTRPPIGLCSQPNCNCALLHASQQPLPGIPRPASKTPTEPTKSEEEPLLRKEKMTPTVTQASPPTEASSAKKRSKLMIGDPRRLTLPLQRMKRIGTSMQLKQIGKARPSGYRPSADKTDGDKPSGVKPSGTKTSADRPNGARSSEDKQSSRATKRKHHVDDKKANYTTQKRGRDGKFRSTSGDRLKKQRAKSVADTAEDEGKENKPTGSSLEIKIPPRADLENSPAGRKTEKDKEKDHVYAPKEFVVEIDPDCYKCEVKGCGKAFRKPSSLDYHSRYFHSPKVQRRRNTSSTSLLSPDIVGMLPNSASNSPSNSQPPSFKKQRTISATESADTRGSMEDFVAIHPEYASSAVMTDDNASDRERPDQDSSDESDETDDESDGTVSVDDIIRCKCGVYEEQGFMIQCEQCLTWQHGDCVQLTIDTVPKKYICYQCSNPEGLRRSFKYKNNYDWFKRGTLPSLMPNKDPNEDKISSITQASHALMEDIINVMDVLDGIKKKLAILKSPFNPCLKYWQRNNKEQQNIDEAADLSKIDKSKKDSEPKLEEADDKANQIENQVKKSLLTASKLKQDTIWSDSNLTQTEDISVNHSLGLQSKNLERRQQNEDELKSATSPKEDAIVEDPALDCKSSGFCPNPGTADETPDYQNQKISENEKKDDENQHSLFSSKPDLKSDDKQKLGYKDSHKDGAGRGDPCSDPNVTGFKNIDDKKEKDDIDCRTEVGANLRPGSDIENPDCRSGGKNNPENTNDHKDVTESSSPALDNKFLDSKSIETHENVPSNRSGSGSKNLDLIRKHPGSVPDDKSGTEKCQSDTLPSSGSGSGNRNTDFSRKQDCRPDFKNEIIGSQTDAAPNSGFGSGSKNLGLISRNNSCRSDEECETGNIGSHEENVVRASPLLESDKVEIQFAKANLLSHVENIEEELSQRMDEIEKNLDFLEDEYKKVGCENSENERKSAFKVTLPDVTSLAKHVRLINRQLLDMC